MRNLQTLKELFKNMKSSNDFKLKASQLFHREALLQLVCLFLRIPKKQMSQAIQVITDKLRIQVKNCQHL